MATNHQIGTQHAPSADRSRWLALAVVCTGGLMVVLDTTIVNVAIPSIKRDLGFSQANLAWVVNAYLISYGGLLLLAGRLGDLLGTKRVFLTGLSLFTATSLLGGLSGTAGMLVGARLVQGVGAAMTMAVSLGIIVTMFSDPRERARAIAIFSGATAAGASVGLLAGGLLTQTVTWHWIFFVNVPVGLVVAVLAQRLVRAVPGIGLDGGADVPGALLVTSALMLGVYTIVATADAGWASGRTVGLGGGAVLLLCGFLVRQVQAAHPLLPLRLFGSRNVSGANAVQALMLAGLLGMFFLGSLYMEGVLGYDPIRIGLAFIPSAGLIALFSFGFAERLNGRFGTRHVLAIALTLIAGGLLLLARVPVYASYLVDVLPAMVLTGIGFGLTFPATMTLAMSHATAGDSGLVSGVIQTSSQVGGSLGLAVLATLATSRTNQLLARGQSRAMALTDGYHLAFIVAAGVLVVAVVLTVSIFRREWAGPLD